MIEGDIKKRGEIGWYELAQDRMLWRKVVRGERVEAGVRRRRKHAKKREKEEEQQKETKAKKKVKVMDPEGAKLECKKCGKVYNREGGSRSIQHNVGRRRKRQL